jgi:hypothetical protein
MQVVRSKGEVGSDGRLRLGVPAELPAGTFRTSMGTLPGACAFTAVAEQTTRKDSRTPIRCTMTLLDNEVVIFLRDRDREEETGGQPFTAPSEPGEPAQHEMGVDRGYRYALPLGFGILLG